MAGEPAATLNDADQRHRAAGELTPPLVTETSSLHCPDQPRGASAWVEIETIRAVIDAYGKSDITLPLVPAKTNKEHIRYAPQVSGEHTYTISTVANFLGWTRGHKHKGDLQPNYACETAFKAIEMIDDGYLQEADLNGLKRSHVAELVRTRETRPPADVASLGIYLGLHPR